MSFVKEEESQKRMQSSISDVFMSRDEQRQKGQ